MGVIRIDVGGEPSGDAEVVYAAQYGPLVGLATLLTGSRAAAEEVVQDAFTAALPRWASLREPELYLKRAVVNRVRSLGRRESRARRLPRRAERVSGEPEIDEAWQLLRRLPQRQRTVLVLRIYLDLPDRDIAEWLGCEEATVRSSAHRALASLRRKLT